MNRTLEALAGRGSEELARLAAMASEVGRNAGLREQTTPEARFGPLMRPIADQEDAAAIVAWTVDVADRGDWKSPPVRGLASVLAVAWATRAAWGRTARRALLALGIVAAVASAVVGVTLVVTEHARARREAQAAELAHEIGRLGQAAATSLAQAEAAWTPSLLDALPSSVRIDIQALGTQARAGVDRARTQADTAPLSEATLSAMSTAQQGAAAYHGRITTWGRAVEARAQVSAIEWPPAYAATRDQLMARIDDAFQRGDVAGVMALTGDAQRWPAFLRQLSHRLRPQADADAAAALNAIGAKVDAAVASANLASAIALLHEERDLADRIAQAYTLRIVDRPGARSGVWRHPRHDASQRDYYLIVEAVDASGAVLTLPVVNEETQRTDRVPTFAVRVPVGTYDAIRAQKERLGRIEQPELGRKASGALNPVYNLPALGGFITEW